MSKANEEVLNMDSHKAPESGAMNALEEQKEQHPMPTPEQEEAVLKKKYGGVIPKKKPLIAKDHERAFFDSADWALGKQGAQKPKGPLEALRPKLQPTHQHTRSRRSAYAPSDDEDVSSGGEAPAQDHCGEDENNVTATVDDQSKQV